MGDLAAVPRAVAGTSGGAPVISRIVHSGVNEGRDAQMRLWYQTVVFQGSR